MGHSSHGDPPWVIRFANIGRLLAAAGTDKAIGQNLVGRAQVAPADGDREFLYFICQGGEQYLQLTCRRETVGGIFDLYVNGVLDSAGYDNYGTGADLDRMILLTRPVVTGLNTFELRVNGKNAASTNYYIIVEGASIQ